MSVNSSASKANHGFTLIELLVVIAIIAILAAILFPVFAQAKMAAKRTAALSNTKQIQLASAMYLNDNEDRFHMIRQWVSADWRAANAPQWAIGAHHQLAPYVKSRDLFHDPGNVVAPDDCDASHGGSVGFMWTHYRADDTNRVFGLHAYHHSTWTEAQRSPHQSLNSSAVDQPAGTINLYPMWFGGSVWEGYGYYRWFTTEIGGMSSSGVLGGLPLYPRGFSVAWCPGKAPTIMSMGNYGGQVNFGFADGHVKSMRRESIMDQTWSTSNASLNIGKKNLLHFSGDYK
jgi:prepilin-type N-terminal cleavage/methylation domain-containing protein/prepilin-type processing-associated H-X9-DG protein